MTRPSYKQAVAWIALNDEDAQTNIAEVRDQVSVLLVADLFDLPPEKVARDVLKVRAKTRP